jgi:hypothetical protein
MADNCGPSLALGTNLSGSGRHIKDDFGGADQPKLKFMFGVRFVYSDMMTDLEAGVDNMGENIFPIKQITRPAPNIIYEDVNYYNYMTKVATKVDFAIVTVTMYDDIHNTVHRIFSKYLESISPIAATTHEGSYDLLQNQGRGDAANMGPHTDEGRNGPISMIRVIQFLPSCRKVYYDYVNPKIQTVALDELDMTQSDVNTITFNFMYDSVHITEINETCPDPVQPEGGEPWWNWWGAVGEAAVAARSGGVPGIGTEDIQIVGAHLWELFNSQSWESEDNTRESQPVDENWF